MVNPPEFDSLEKMNHSQWQQSIADLFVKEQFPTECIRCQQVEQEGNDSIRAYATILDQSETQRNYLQVGGVLDNLCNAACQTCGPECSTKIGSLENRVFPIVNNSKQY
jgi:hypothetical protein